MTTIRMLFHVHTRASFDGMMSPASIINFCRRHDIGVLAITDHDTDAALEQAATLAQQAGMRFIPAVEYNSTDGDVVGLFCHQPIQRVSGNETIRQIHDAGGIAVLPHPAHGHRLENIDISAVDLIEVFNARCSARENEAARELAARHGKPVIAGADAHLPWDLNTCFNDLNIDDETGEAADDALRRALLGGMRIVIRRRSPYLSIPISQMIKAAKQRRPGLFFHQFLSIGKHYARAALRGGRAHD